MCEIHLYEFINLHLYNFKVFYCNYICKFLDYCCEIYKCID